MSRLHTHVIPEDYIKGFDGMLQRMITKIFSTEGKAALVTWVISLDIIVLREERAVILKTIITRPCAERRGFARIALFHLMRVCYAADYDLIVDEPSLEMLRLLETAFNQQTIHDMDLGDSGRPIRVNLCHRQHLGNPWILLRHGLSEKVWFEHPGMDHDYDLPTLHLRPECFPTARYLNHGP